MAMITYDPSFSESQSAVRGISLREGVLSLINPSKNSSYPDGCNIPCCTKTFEMTKNIIIDNQELLIVANLMTYGSTIGYIYKNVGGIWTYEAPIRTVEAITTFTKSRTCSAEIAVYANTVSTTNANLSGSINAVCMYELPNLTNVNYDVLSKYTMTPCYGRSGVSLATGVVLHGNATPVNPLVDAVNSDFEFNRTDAKQFSASMRDNETGISIVLPKWVSAAKGFKVNAMLGGGNATYGVPTVTLMSSLDGTNWTERAVYTASTNLYIPNVIAETEKSTTQLRLTFGQDNTHGRFCTFTVDVVDPIIGNNDQVRHVLIIQGSIGAKNITINGRQRLQYMPTIENVPQMNLTTPVVYSPLVFELYNLLLRTQNYSLVMTRPEFLEFVAGIANMEDAAILNLVGTASEGKASLLGAGMAISNLWKKAVKVAKGLGIQPAQLLRSGVSKLGDLANSGINWMESAGYATTRHGYASEPKSTEQVVSEIPDLMCTSHELLYIKSIPVSRQEQLDKVRDAVVCSSSKYNKLLKENQELIDKVNQITLKINVMEKQLKGKQKTNNQLLVEINNQEVRNAYKTARIVELEFLNRTREREIGEINVMLSRLRKREAELQEESEILRKQRDRTRKLLTQQLNISQGSVEKLTKKLYEIAIIMNSFVKYDSYVHLDQYLGNLKMMLQEEMEVNDRNYADLIDSISKDMVSSLLTRGFIDGEELIERYFSYGTASEQNSTYYDTLKGVPDLFTLGTASIENTKPAVKRNDACIKADQANISSSQIWDAFGMGVEPHSGFAMNMTVDTFQGLGNVPDISEIDKSQDVNLEQTGKPEVKEAPPQDIVTKEKVRELMDTVKPITYGENFKIKQGDMKFTRINADASSIIVNNNFWYCNNVTTDFNDPKFADAERTSMFVVVEHATKMLIPWLYLIQVSFKPKGTNYESFGSIQIDKRWAYKKDEAVSFFNFCLGDNRLTNFLSRLKKYGKTLYITFTKPADCTLDTFSGTSWTGAFYAALFARDALNVYEATACGRAWVYDVGGRKITSYYSALAPVGDMEIKAAILQSLSPFINQLQEYNGPLSLILATHATNVEKVPEAWKNMVVFGNRTVGIDLFQPQVWLVSSDSSQLIGRTRYKVLLQTTIERQVIYNYDNMKQFITKIVPNFKLKFKGKERIVDVKKLLDDVSKLNDDDTAKIAYKNLYGPYNFFTKKQRLAQIGNQPFKPEEFDQFNQLQSQIAGIYKTAMKDIIKDEIQPKKIKVTGASFVLPEGVGVSNLERQTLNEIIFKAPDKTIKNSKADKKRKRKLEALEKKQGEAERKLMEKNNEKSSSESED